MLIFFLFIIAMFFESISSMPRVLHLFITIILLSIWIIMNGLDLYRKKLNLYTLIPKACVLAAFAIYQFFKNQTSWFYYILSQTTKVFSTFVGVFINKPIEMGITYSGIDIVVLFIIVIVTGKFLYKFYSYKKTALYIAIILLIWAFYIGLWTILAESSIALGLNLIEPITGPLDYRFVLFLFLLGFYMFVFHKKEEIPSVIKFEGRKTSILLSALISFVVLNLITPQLPFHSIPTDRVKKILFWDTGIDFTVPKDEKYGLDNVGMFGVLPHYLKQKGYICSTVKEINKELLDGANVLVIFNPTFTPTKDTLLDIWSFVEEGGSVLAVGDHTGDKQIRLPLNTILKPSGISLKFDSAIPFKTLWADSLQLRADPVLNGIKDREVQIVVGASLLHGINAKPLIIGKNGYSDTGDYDNASDGFLGDMHFSRGERIGDLVLAAKASYGKGSFMAFGDTSTFQNTVIPYSHVFIDNIFEELCITKQIENTEGKSDSFFKASGIIDFTHLEVLGRDKSGDSIDGFIACAMRAGIMPYLNQTEMLSDKLETSDNTKFILFIEPAIKFWEYEQKVITTFMEKGGSVIICADFNSPKASRELLKHYKFSFDPMPIGRISPNKNPEMAFWNACPILYDGKIIEENNKQVDSLMEIWGNTVIAYKAIGDGGLYVIADTDFLKNKNIEDVETFREGNILYLKEMFGSILE